MRPVLQIMVGRLLVLLILLPMMAFAAPSSSNPYESIGEQSAVLKIANRPIFEFRTSLLGESPAVRAARASEVINDVLESSGSLTVRVESIQNRYMILIGERRAFIVAPQDVNPLHHERVEQAAKEAADNLRQVIAEDMELHDLRFMLKAGGYSLIATLLFYLFVRAINYLRSKSLKILPSLMHRHTKTLKVGDTQVLDVNQLYPLVTRLGATLRWALFLLLSYEWLSFVLSQFPYTRPWGESLNTYFLEVASYILLGIVSAVPGLGIAVAIYFMARWVSSFLQRLLRRMAASGKTENWLNTETLTTSQRLTSISIWLFALAMAYPYLPGAGTEAFKGLSVLLGLMVSLGASSVIGQAASGLILTYTRTLRPGEYVRIGDHEGTVTEMGMFTTRIRTGLGEVLSIPNAMITNTVTKNYSRTVHGDGYVVDTTVTIGYDTPWRQVEAMLLEAARRTEGILGTPVPQVFQTALTDFYPEYRLVAQAIPSQPRPRAALLSALHANIQDVFNENGVQIMSPHYVNDPLQAKLVANTDWNSSLAEKP